MLLPLDQKNIILGISGGIASYKSVDLVSSLKKLGANVYVVLSESAESFVSKLSLEVMSANRVFTRESKHTVETHQHLNLNTKSHAYIDHIHLAQIADLILIAPATANTIGKLAHAISDDLIYDIILATKARVLIAPAMNTNMWSHIGVQENIKRLEEVFAYSIIPPEEGILACNTRGIGRLAEIDSIITAVNQLLASNNSPSLQFNSKERTENLLNKNLLISAGGTREYIDPVRFISNDSSGEMGFALAQEALYRGANVILVSTVDYRKDPIKSAVLDHPNLLLLVIGSAEEMLMAMEANFNESIDAVIMAAAVSDYKPVNYSSEKIKKSSSEPALMTLELKENPDIIKSLSATKAPHQTMVGFCLESDEILNNAKKKLKEKNLDMIVANDISALNSSDSAITIIYPSLEAADGEELEIISLNKQEKSLNAGHILDHLGLLLKSKSL